MESDSKFSCFYNWLFLKVKHGTRQLDKPIINGDSAHDSFHV
jgi:hypothetical protein